MWGTKRIAAALLAASMLIGLPSCSTDENAGEVMIQPVENASTNQNVKLAGVTVGSVVRNYSADGSIRYKEQTIVCEYDDARIVGYAVGAGDSVAKGDVLATVAISYSEADLQSLKAELEIAKSAASRRKGEAATSVSGARQSLSEYDGDDAAARRRLELALERAEINEKLTARSAESSVAAAQERVDEFVERISHTTIVAPADGYVANVEIRAEGAALPRGGKICTLVTYDDVSLVGTSELSGAVRYGMTMTISARTLDGEYAAKVIAAPNIEGTTTGQFALEIPSELMKTFTETADSLNPSTMDGGGMGGPGRQSVSLPSGIRLETERVRVDDAMTVPNGAVQTEDGKRFVYVMRDGALRKRFIATGASDDKNTQVLDGLEVGEQVSVG